MEEVLGMETVESRGRSRLTGAEDILAHSEHKIPVVKTEQYLVDLAIKEHFPLKSLN
jgi:hypothetical protein